MVGPDLLERQWTCTETSVRDVACAPVCAGLGVPRHAQSFQKRPLEAVASGAARRSSVPWREKRRPFFLGASRRRHAQLLCGSVPSAVRTERGGGWTAGRLDRAFPDGSCRHMQTVSRLFLCLLWQWPNASAWHLWGSAMHAPRPRGGCGRALRRYGRRRIALLSGGLVAPETLHA